MEDTTPNISGMVKHTQNEQTYSKYLMSPSLVMARGFLGVIFYFCLFLWLHLKHYEGLQYLGVLSFNKFGLDNNWKFTDSH